MKKKIIPFLFVGLLLSCESKNIISINVASESDQIDSIFVLELITEKVLFKIPVNGKSGEKIDREIEHSTTASIQTKDGKHNFLTILHPDKKINIFIEKDSSIMNNDLGDSLLNYLWKSNNKFIAENAGFIFASNEMDSIIGLFKNFEEKGKIEIENRSSKLSSEEKGLLLYQNSARIHSFLFYLGRLVKNIPANHQFFSFIEEIDNNTHWAKTLPQNLLYKHEINYLLTYDSIQSVELFMDYLAIKTLNKDLLDFLKAIYISEVITRPSYWKKHERFLTTQTVKQIIAKEKLNTYRILISKPLSSFFSSQKGEEAYDFEAQRIDGSKVKLSDFKGKVVFIDSWASWCGPCLDHRPRVLELAEKYASNENVQILMISLDSERTDWITYLRKKNQLRIKGDLLILDGMNSEYGDHYNLKSIPKYILISKEGEIINSNIPEPSIAVEEMIDYELTKN